MRYVMALSLALALAGGVRAISPPVHPPPVILPSPPPGPIVLPPAGPGGGPTPPPVLDTPEPASLTIAGIGIAAAGAYRLLRRAKKV